jgi:hypothetical protein
VHEYYNDCKLCLRNRRVQALHNLDTKLYRRQLLYISIFSLKLNFSITQPVQVSHKIYPKICLQVAHLSMSYLVKYLISENRSSKFTINVSMTQFSEVTNLNFQDPIL